MFGIAFMAWSCQPKERAGPKVAVPAKAAAPPKESLLPKEFPAARRETAQAESTYERGLALQRRGRLAEALPLFRQAIRLDPDLAGALNHLAWLEATHPDAKLRDGPEAVRLAERACRAMEIGGREWRPSGVAADCLDTLAAAYAEVGRFDDAIKTVRRAIEMVDRYDYWTRLDLYKAKRPYREPGEPRE
jgi:tetratricopeptide (TPR) repeat protein